MCLAYLPKYVKSRVLLMPFGFDSLLRVDFTLICSGVYGLFLRISFIAFISLCVFSLDVRYSYS
jgi:hypothetical protein